MRRIDEIRRDELYAPRLRRLPETTLRDEHSATSRPSGRSRPARSRSLIVRPRPRATRSRTPDRPSARPRRRRARTGRRSGSRPRCRRPASGSRARIPWARRARSRAPRRARRRTTRRGSASPAGGRRSRRRSRRACSGRASPPRAARVWKCMPRSVPARALREMLHWATLGVEPVRRRTRRGTRCGRRSRARPRAARARRGRRPGARSERTSCAGSFSSRGQSEHDLPARERLGEPLGGDRLEAAQTHQPRERLAVEPVLAGLAREVPLEERSASPRRSPRSAARRRSASRGRRRPSGSRTRGSGGCGTCSRSARRRAGGPGGGRAACG